MKLYYLTACLNTMVEKLSSSTALLKTVLYSQAISAMRLRQEMCHYLEWHMNKITRDNVSKLMQKLLEPHLGWVVVWGCLLGAVMGAVSQALGISLSFNYSTS